LGISFAVKFELDANSLISSSLPTEAPAP